MVLLQQLIPFVGHRWSIHCSLHFCQVAVPTSNTFVRILSSLLDLLSAVMIDHLGEVKLLFFQDTLDVTLCVAGFEGLTFVDLLFSTS